IRHKPFIKWSLPPQLQVSRNPDKETICLHGPLTSKFQTSKVKIFARVPEREIVGSEFPPCRGVGSRVGVAPVKAGESNCLFTSPVVSGCHCKLDRRTVTTWINRGQPGRILG